MIIVTQLSPDLDACMAVWLLKRFGQKEHKEAKVQFVSMGESVANVPEEELVYVDTGGGAFDHHNTDAYVCAASLVLDHLKLHNDKALKEMVDYTLKADHGLLIKQEISDFDVINIISGLNKMYTDSPKKVVEACLVIFDALYISIKRRVKATEEINRAKQIKTKWGLALAIETDNQYVRYLAHKKGFNVFVFINPDKGYRGFMAPGKSGVDFSPIYNKLVNLEPEADWFLHSSKELLLCGSYTAPRKKLSKLTLDKLIELVEEDT